MTRATAILTMVGWLAGSTAAWALTSLAHVTPQNLEKHRFTLTSRAGRNDTVEFVIRRDVRGISRPGKRAYLKDANTEPRSLGTPVKLEEADQRLTFRFSVPAQKVASAEFTLWGEGMVGEGVTFRFRLGEFWKPKPD